MAATTARVLRLLSLLQSRPVWTGPELADRLQVTTRSIRRDVERLRELGYPVRATQGVGGGYQLGAGRALPPLLLDDDEAVAVAVCLGLAAGGTVEGLGEAAVRTLAKLDQVLPSRLRGQVEAVHGATVTLDSATVTVDSATLLALARASRAAEIVTFGYERADGRPSERRVEPYRLVATGRRWYLLAWDLDRDDWRVFRLDRIGDVPRSTGWRFTRRPEPDAAEFVQRSLTQSPYRHVARVLVQAPQAVVAQRVPATAATVEAVDDRTCLLTAGADYLDALAYHLSALGHDFEVLEPAELRESLRLLGERMLRAAGPAAPVKKLTPVCRGR